MTFVENNPSYQSKSEGVNWTLIPKCTCTVPTDVCRHQLGEDGGPSQHTVTALHTSIYTYIRTCIGIH